MKCYQRKQRIGFITTLIMVLATADSASAFYWRGWPGSRVIAVPSLIDSKDPNPGIPPGDPIPLPETENVYIPPFGPPPTPENVPEPATGIASVLGLGAVYILKRVRKLTRRS